MNDARDGKEKETKPQLSFEYISEYHKHICHDFNNKEKSFKCSVCEQDKIAFHYNVKQLMTKADNKKMCRQCQDDYQNTKLKDNLVKVKEKNPKREKNKESNEMGDNPTETIPNNEIKE